MAQIGIDLGTTNSVAAVHSHGKTEIILSREHERHFPSVVAVRRGGLLAGSPAMAGGETFRSVKRFIGRRFDEPLVARAREAGNLSYSIVPDPEQDGPLKVQIGDTALSPTEVAAEILKKIKQDAEACLGEPVTHAVITVPAYFHDNQRVCTRDAGAMAGLRVMQVLHEPTAAALAFGNELGQQRSADVRRILVYDLGGGTFDVSLMSLADGIPMVETIEGDPFCGGDDFDHAIVRFVLDELERTCNVKRAAMTAHPRFMHGLWRRAERAKVVLSQAPSADIEWLDAPRIDGEEIEVEVTVQRKDFEAWIRPEIERTLELVQKTLVSAELTPEEIDDVLLVGGSTAIPLVRHMLAELFGAERLRTHVNPMEGVALGAALRASEQRKLVCPNCEHPNEETAEACAHCKRALAGALETLVCPACGCHNPLDAVACRQCERAFATAAEGRTAMPYGISLHGGGFGLLVPKDTPIPTLDPFEQEFATTQDGQRALMIEVCEGAAPRAEDNQLVGCVVVPIPEQARGPAGLRMRVGLNVDHDSILTVVVNGIGPLAEVGISARLERGKKLRLCTTCGEPNANNERCARCGEPAPEETAPRAASNRCPNQDCRADNPTERDVCGHCGARLRSADPVWRKRVERVGVVMAVARMHCGWLLSPAQRELAAQFQHDAERALAEDDEAGGQKVLNQCEHELEGGEFAGVGDLIWAETVANNHTNAQLRARVGGLLVRFRQAWAADREQGILARQALAQAIDEEGAPRSDSADVDLRPVKLV